MRPFDLPVPGATLRATYLQLCSFFLAVPAYADEVPDPAPELGARVENGNGTYSRTIAAADVPTGPVVDGALTWAYVGQAQMGRRSSGSEPIWTSFGGPRTSPMEDLRRSRRDDRLGRAWEVVAVDDCRVCGRRPRVWLRSHLRPPR